MPQSVKRGMNCGMESFRGIIRRGVASCKGVIMGVAYCARRKMGVAFVMAASYRLVDLTDIESPKEKRERQSF